MTLLDYPEIMPDELFYTYMLRYHAYSGNSSLTSTNNELSKIYTNIREPLFPHNIGGCLDELGISKNDYIYNHSPLVYFKLFLPIDKFRTLANRTRCRYITWFYGRYKKGSSSLCHSILYCPVCMKERYCYSSIKTYQQIDGVYVCPIHHCYLNEQVLNEMKIITNLDKWDYTVTPCEKDGIFEEIAKDVMYVFEHKPKAYNKKIRACLMTAALYRGVFLSKKWKEKKYTEWRDFYSNLPEEYSKYANVASFKRYCSEKPNDKVDPIEYILFIRSLYGSLENFLKIYDLV